MDSLAQIIFAGLLGLALVTFAQGYADGKKCVVSKADADAMVEQNIDYSQYDW